MTDIQKDTNQNQTPEPEKKAPAKSKKQILIDMLQSENGATKKQMMEATGWKDHTVRGMMSGALKKGLNLNIKTTKNKDGDLVYRIVE